MKRRRLEPFLKDGSGEDDLAIGAWLEKAEMRFMRVGQLRSRLERERCEVLKKMANLEEVSVQEQIQNQNSSLQEEDLAPDRSQQEGLHSQGPCLSNNLMGYRLAQSVVAWYEAQSLRGRHKEEGEQKERKREVERERERKIVKERGR